MGCIALWELMHTYLKLMHQEQHTGRPTACAGPTCSREARSSLGEMMCEQTLKVVLTHVNGCQRGFNTLSKQLLREV